MTERLPTRVFIHAVPGAFVLIALTWMVAHMHALPASTADLLRYTPYYVFAIGLLLSAAFHRNRIFHALLLLGACNAALIASARLTPNGSELLVALIGIALPLNLALISCLGETGILARQGLTRLGILVVQAIVIAVAVRFYTTPVLVYVSRPFVRLLLFERFRGLPHAALLAFVVASLVLLVQAVRRRFRPTDLGFYWVLITSFVAVCVADSARLASLAFGCGAIVLVIALLEAFYTMAYFDELTDLPSRRSFNDAKLRLSGTYTVAMVDVDHFKKFNDTYGHDAGDQVLRMVAARLAEISGGGKSYRFGGEEFTVLFPGKFVDETFPHLERLRRSIEEIPFKLRSQDRRGGKKKRLSMRRRGAKEQTNITVSIGVAGVNGEKYKPDDMVKAADTALYKAKACGRNCTIISDTEPVAV